MENKRKKSDRFENQEAYMLSASETAKKVALQRKINAVHNYYGFRNKFSGFQEPERIEDILDEGKLHLFYLNQCSCPLTIANAFINAKNALYNDYSTFGIIAQNISKTTQESFERWCDKNQLSKEIKRNYISKEGFPIDSQAHAFTENFEILITEEDIVDFILLHPHGAESYERYIRCNELSNKFKEMVGFPLNFYFAGDLLKLISEKYEAELECPF
ncbi:hypothetical protein AD998_07595 [bacterium 336/3]|nr:hypothetical protein AD998_07595 [bacterium 336/3]